jgi:hypothetical protein
LLNPSEIKIQIFEKQDIFGPGFPHCDRNVMPFHITNMCAKDMGILVGHPEDFQDWATINHERLKERYQWIDDTSFSYEGCNHYPRPIMGEYLKERFQEAHQKAHALGLGVELFSGSEVIDLEERSDDKIHLTVKQLLSGSTFSCIADPMFRRAFFTESNDRIKMIMPFHQFIFLLIWRSSPRLLRSLLCKTFLTRGLIPLTALKTHRHVPFPRWQYRIALPEPAGCLLILPTADITEPPRIQPQS